MICVLVLLVAFCQKVEFTLELSVVKLHFTCSLEILSLCYFMFRNFLFENWFVIDYLSQGLSVSFCGPTVIGFKNIS